MRATVFHAQLWGKRDGKYSRLLESDLNVTEWADLAPQAPLYLFVPRDAALSTEYERGWRLVDIFPINSVGIVTARDRLTIQWSAPDVWQTVRQFASLPVEVARQRYALGRDARDWKVQLAQEDVRASGPDRAKVVPILYRPFDTRFTYYTAQTRGFICMPRPGVMRHMLADRNLGMISARSNKSASMDHFFTTRRMIETKCGESTTQSCILPIYVYPGSCDQGQREVPGASRWPPGKGGRLPNLAPDFVAEMEEKLGQRFVPDGLGDLRQTVGPEDIFHYIYAIFHSPTYRKRYAEFLKRDFPRVPLTSDLALFRNLCQKGADLVALHLVEGDYGAASWNRGEPQRPSPFHNLMSTFPVKGDDVVEKVFYLAPGEPEPGTGKPLPPGKGRVYISKDRPKAEKKGQYFEGVPPEVWGFHVGGYQVCRKWLKDRKGRKLSYDDVQHYHRIIVALNETIRLMAEIDAAIPHWPIE